MKKNDNATEKIPRLKKSIFPQFGRVIVYCLLIAILIVLIVANQNIDPFGVTAWYVTFPAAIVLLGDNAIKFWVVKHYPVKIVCYVFDILSLMVLTMFSDGTLISILYLTILSEFYLNQKSVTANVAMWITSMFIFLVTFALSSVFKSEGFSLVRLLSNAFNDLILFIVHFFAMNFVVQLTRKNRELLKTSEELNNSNEKLRVAYNELKEITALEERQRIAKDIHDTAGHSITTVIMQTEAAKIAVDNNPDEAKKRITAANLQAKHALEELRESVHLLSGNLKDSSLKEKLESIISESMEGTDIAIRYDLDDITLGDLKARLILNTLKEGISNGLRHGNATAFYFELKEKDGRVEFLLSDNGAGMDAEQLKEGFGLAGMHRRAESLGGTVWFETEPDEGFEIHMTLPSDSKNKSVKER
ncbi:MAG: sensor histidine kinase [Clostridia bacterium]|nr:sensor histidine kinase [Clostridia bacterium]